VRQKNRPAWLLLLRPVAENPGSILPEQVSESAEIWIRDPIEVPRCSRQSGTPYMLNPLHSFFLISSQLQFLTMLIFDGSGIFADLKFSITIRAGNSYFMVEPPFALDSSHLKLIGYFACYDLVTVPGNIQFFVYHVFELWVFLMNLS
jgi:hypothetical protein